MKWMGIKSPFPQTYTECAVVVLRIEYALIYAANCVIKTST